MANFTAKAIKESFLKLLNEKPLSKISVKDIVEDCGINRNSFYYHYQDIPTLLEEIITDDAQRIIEEYPSIDSLEKCIEATASYALKNKSAVLHIYNSVSRDAYESYLMKVSDHVVRLYLDTVFKDVTVSDAGRETTVRTVRSLIFGLITDWMMHSMDEDIPKSWNRSCELLNGLAQTVIERSDRK